MRLASTGRPPFRVLIAGVLAAAALCVPARALAQPVPGATYTGSIDGGGTVELTVSNDGKAVTRFMASDVPGTMILGTCTLTFGGTGTVPIVNNAFHSPLTGALAFFDGSFPGSQHAQGTLSDIYQGCYTGKKHWTASTTAPPPDRVPPNAFGFVLRPSSFRPARSGPSVLTGGNVGAKVSYGLSEDASMTFTVEQALSGRRKGNSCLPDTRARRRLPRCTRYVRLAGSFKHAGHTGTNSFRFSGRLASRTLKPGSYRLIATARDRAGNVSRPARASFTIRR